MGLVPNLSKTGTKHALHHFKQDLMNIGRSSKVSISKIIALIRRCSLENRKWRVNSFSKQVYIPSQNHIAFKQIVSKVDQNKFTFIVNLRRSLHKLWPCSPSEIWFSDEKLINMTKLSTKKNMSTLLL